jgi:hypothetical protein
VNTFLIGAAAFVVGLVLGVAGEWRLLKSWVQLALDQSAVLHTDERTPRHAPRGRFMAGPDDFEARNRIGGRR